MAKINILRFVLIALVVSLSLRKVNAQPTVFTIWKADRVLADEHYAERHYRSALALYLRIAGKEKASPEVDLNIARCYYRLREYKDAARWYDPYFQAGKLLPADLYNYAEAQCALKKYGKAIRAYKAFVGLKPENEFVMRKIWRLDNIRFLFEDSLHYAVNSIAINTAMGELCPVPYSDGLIFLSNRKAIEIIEQIDASTNTPFYRLYYTGRYVDSLSHAGDAVYAGAGLWHPHVGAKFHQGPVAFFHDEKNMVFSRTGETAGQNGERTLQLFFAAKREGEWQEAEAFPFNSVEYSISDPSISDDGSVLYFSSDMKGGKGGKDLYRSTRSRGKWSKPVNLADLNTPYDEVSPFMARNGVLYFSSNGHAGLGGLDIFKVPRDGEASGEIQNCGYPINSSWDDFGLVVDSLNTRGYFSSNRKNGGNDDDIYEFDVDLQTYPLVIDGRIRYKEIQWSDSSELIVLPNATLSLIDNIRNVPVYECRSDSTGHFRIEVPYFSTYKIKVTASDNVENIVSLEIPRHRKTDGRHEIVIVKDPFKANGNESSR